MSGKAWRIFLRSSLAHTMKAFMGLLMWLLFRDSEKWREPGGPVGRVRQVTALGLAEISLAWPPGGTDEAQTEVSSGLARQEVEGEEEGQGQQ